MRNTAPVDTSHSLTVSSQLALARVLPSALKATEMTTLECPGPVCTTGGKLVVGLQPAATSARQSVVKDAAAIQGASQFVRVLIMDSFLAE